MEEIYEGKLEWVKKFWDDDDPEHFTIDGGNLNSILNHLEDKNIRLTIEVLTEQGEDDEPTINLHLNQVVRNEYLCNALGYNPYCVHEGADGTAIVQVKLSDAKKAGII